MTGCHSTNDVSNKGKTAQRKYFHRRRHCPSFRYPSPTLLPLLPQGPEAALGALMWGGGRLTEKPSCESLLGCHDEVGSPGVVASINAVHRLRVRVPSSFSGLGPPTVRLRLRPCRCPRFPSVRPRPVNWPRVNKPSIQTSKRLPNAEPSSLSRS